MTEENIFKNIYPTDVKLSDFVVDTDMFMDSVAASYLLNQEVLFINNYPYITNPWAPQEKQKVGPETTVIFVICNDVFAWGCGDAEPIKCSENIGCELYELLKLYLENKTWGVIKWVSIKRNERPQKPIVDSMKQISVWDETMEALPLNKYDQICYDATNCSIHKPDVVSITD